jgi:outer membrane protein OmpA-like peptidoglycan-associated protein
MNLRNTNPWLASCGGNMRAMRPTRPSRRPARSVRLWAGALLAVLLTFAITAGQHVAAEGAAGSPGRHPLDQNGGVVVSSPGLDRYLAALEERATERRFLLTFGDLLFDGGSAQIGDSEKRQLVRMGDFLRAHPATVAQIVGHADDRGEVTANSQLAQQRAAAVRSYLVVQGIDPSRLTVASRGADDPLQDNRTQSGRAGNRRVEILVQRLPMDSSASSGLLQ